MTDFKRHCKIFDKFLLLLKRQNMGYESDVLENGDIELRFWYVGTNYKEHGCNIWVNGEIGVRYAFYKAYEKAITFFKDYDPSKFKNVIYELEKG